MSKIAVRYTRTAQDAFCALPECVQRYLSGVISAQAQYGHEQMCVVGWTFDLPDHIYRCIKALMYKPGIRVIFHFETACLITIDRIAWRDADPYLDGK